MLYAEVNLDALRDNLRRLRELRGDAGILFVVKGDAYGHGLVEAVEAAAGLVDWFGVGTLSEARRIRSLGIKLPVLILLPPPARDLPGAIRDGFHFVVGDWMQLVEAERAAAGIGAPAFVHIAVDTGAGPFGFPPAEVEGLLRELSHSPHVEPVAICSHLPASHSPEGISLTHAQIACLRELLGRLKRRRFGFPFAHIANSAAFLSFPETSAEPFNLVRVGVAAYGYVDGFWREWGLRPVARVWGEVLVVRAPKPGIAPRGPRKVAILDAGYRHGLSESIRWAWINGARTPFVGKPGMDHAVLDVSEAPGVKPGSEALLFDGTGENFRGWFLPALVPMLAQAERSWKGIPARAAVGPGISG